jgi:hypothetical protein
MIAVYFLNKMKTSKISVNFSKKKSWNLNSNTIKYRQNKQNVSLKSQNDKLGNPSKHQRQLWTTFALIAQAFTTGIEFRSHYNVSRILLRLILKRVNPLSHQ